MHKQSSGNFVDPTEVPPIPPAKIVTTALLEPLCGFADCYRDSEAGKTVDVMIFGEVHTIAICADHDLALRFVK